MVELISKYNAVNKRKFNTNSVTNIRTVENAVALYGRKVVEAILDEPTDRNLQDVLSRENVTEFMNKRGLSPEFEISQKQVKTEAMSLGMLETALAHVMLEVYAPQVSLRIQSQIDEYIKNKYGPISREIVYSVPGKGKIEDEVTHEELETVAKFVMADEPVFLVGPAGTGKNVIAHQISKLLGLTFYTTNAVTQEFKLTGFIDAMGRYHETEFYKAFTKGGLFFLDEMDGSIAEALLILNGAIANRYFDFPTGRVDAHPDFRVISAGNTYGHGASYQYVGRNQLDGASLNRFAVVEIGYSPAIEMSMTQDTELLNFIRDFRKVCFDAQINHIVSYREIKRVDKMMKMDMPIEKVLKTSVIKNLQVDDLKIIIPKLNQGNKYTEGMKRCLR